MSFGSPTEGDTVSGGIDVEVSATDNVGGASVSRSVDGGVLATDSTAPYAFFWDASEAPNGSPTLTATATDAAGNTANAEITVIVDNPVPDTTAPTVSIASPTDGAAVSGTVTVEGNAGDDVGLASVALSLDGVEVATMTDVPWAWEWDSSTVDDGAHTLTAVAYDNAGNSAPCSVSVEVSNSTPEPDPAPVTETFEGSVNRRNPEKTFDILVGADGTLDVEVTFGGRKNSLSCSVTDSGGQVIATATGGSPLTLDPVAVTAGTYTIQVRAGSKKTVGFTLTVTHP